MSLRKQSVWASVPSTLSPMLIGTAELTAQGFVLLTLKVTATVCGELVAPDDCTGTCAV